MLVSGPPLLHLDDPLPWLNLKMLGLGKEGGLSGIYPELVLCGNPVKNFPHRDQLVMKQLMKLIFQIFKAFGSLQIPIIVYLSMY